EVLGPPQAAVALWRKAARHGVDDRGIKQRQPLQVAAIVEKARFTIIELLDPANQDWINTQITHHHFSSVGEQISLPTLKEGTGIVFVVASAHGARQFRMRALLVQAQPVAIRRVIKSAYLRSNG